MNLKDLYIDFFISKGHKQIPSAPVVPENDPSVLFNTAGMQPLVPYLLGQPHPLGTRLVDYQKCIRLTDLDSVGDKTHHTFFEMLGNWSLGDYFKEDSIKWSYEFLTKVLKIPNERLAITVFGGNDEVGPDTESYNLWIKMSIPEERIVFLGVEDNWWGPAGETGPCGPDTEIFYWRSDEEIPKTFDPNNDNWVEIWNNVFMEFNKDKDGNFILLDKKNVDTGMGYERTTAILEGVNDNYLSSAWRDIISKIEELSGISYEQTSQDESLEITNNMNRGFMRIVADHIRTAVIISGEPVGIKPSNTDQGYILRRLIRRAIRYAKSLNIDINSDWEQQIAIIIIDKYSKYYPELEKYRSTILEVLGNEKIKFTRTLEKGLKEFDKIINTIKGNYIPADLAFKLYDTYGFPIELTIELAHEKKFVVDENGFHDKFLEHQAKSRAGSTQKFKGGLADTNEITTKYHTATHLLNAVLKEVLGNHVHQMGSNITAERMRFDFSHNEKLTDQQKTKIEELMNKYISLGSKVICYQLSKSEAIASGAEAMFIEKYGDQVTVYEIEKLSKEICGGPHVSDINELGHFKIIKEEASSAGVRRIKAILE